MAWAADGAAHGSLVVADFQTAGRGRLGRTWVAPPPAPAFCSRWSCAGSAPRRAGSSCSLWPRGWPSASVWPASGMEPGLEVAQRRCAGRAQGRRHLAELPRLVVILGVGINVEAGRVPGGDCNDRHQPRRTSGPAVRTAWRCCVDLTRAAGSGLVTGPAGRGACQVPRVVPDAWAAGPGRPGARVCGGPGGRHRRLRRVGVGRGQRGQGG